MNSTHSGVARAAGTSSRQRTARLPFGRDAVRLARARIVADLVGRGISGQVVEEAESIVAELVSNSVRHASPLTDGTVRLHWRARDGVVEVEVTDGGGESIPRPAPRTVWLSSGRGLRIVRSIAHEWGVTEDRTGNVVWATLGGPSRRRAT
jgi:serine/threonine-protein kinase RsbW